MPKVFHEHEQVCTERWCPEPLIVIDRGTEARRQAEEIITAARLQIEAIMSSAADEAERIKENAFVEGLAEGRLAGEQSFASACDDAQRLITEVEAERDAFFQHIEPDLIRLAVSIAEKVVTRQLSLHPECIVDIVRVHLQQLRERERVQARVHPGDLPMLHAAREMLMQEVEGLKELQFVDDQHFQHGDLILESPAGALDARIATKIAVISTGLDHVLEGADDGANN